MGNKTSTMTVMTASGQLKKVPVGSNVKVNPQVTDAQIREQMKAYVENTFGRPRRR